MPMYFDTLDKALSFLLAFEHRDMMWSWKVRLLSIFIPSSSLEELALIHEFCLCIDFVSYGFPILLTWVQLLCENLAYLRPYKTRQNSPFLSDIIIRSMLKDMRDNITRHHNIPFLLDNFTRSMHKVMKDNKTILSALITEISLRLASVLIKLRKVRICH